jgi:hypothetical protein
MLHFCTFTLTPYIRAFLRPCSHSAWWPGSLFSSGRNDSPSPSAHHFCSPAQVSLQLSLRLLPARLSLQFLRNERDSTHRQKSSRPRLIPFTTSFQTPLHLFHPTPNLLTTFPPSFPWIRQHTPGDSLRIPKIQSRAETTHTFKPASPESVYSFSMVLLLPPAPAARAEEGRGAVGARRLCRCQLLHGQERTRKVLGECHLVEPEGHALG